MRLARSGAPLALRLLLLQALVTLLPGSAGLTGVVPALPVAARERTATLGQEHLAGQALQLQGAACPVLCSVPVGVKLTEGFAVMMESLVELAVLAGSMTMSLARGVTAWVTVMIETADVIMVIVTAELQTDGTTVVVDAIDGRLGSRLENTVSPLVSQHIKTDGSQGKCFK